MLSFTGGSPCSSRSVRTGPSKGLSKAYRYNFDRTQTDTKRERYCTDDSSTTYMSDLSIYLHNWEDIENGRCMKERIVINVGGEIYETFVKTLNKFPETLLGTSAKRSLLLKKGDGQIFINRKSLPFASVLFYYQSSGNLICPTHMPMADFEEECLFYELPDKAVELMKLRENYLHKRKTKIQCNVLKASIINFIDYPSGYLSLAYFSVMFVLIIYSITIYCADTILVFYFSGSLLQYYVLAGNRFELALNVVFALEYVMRLYVCPSIKEFVLQPINTIEFFSIFPYLALYSCPDHVINHFLMAIFRLLRVFRLARLSRISNTIQVAMDILHGSIHDVMTMCYITLILTILPAAYYILSK